MSKPCEEYITTGLWDYDFKIEFQSDDTTGNYLRVPLATFAANSDQSGTCVIYVEYLDSQ